MTPVEETVRRIVQCAEGAADEYGLSYQETVRALAYALVSINEDQRQLVNQEGDTVLHLTVYDDLVSGESRSLSVG